MTADAWAWLATRLEGDHRLREVLTRAFVEELMAVEVEARCRAETGERVNRRNGYRAGAFAMPSGSIAVRVPKLRHGGYAPQWLATGPDGPEDVLVASLCRGYVEGMSSDLAARLVGAVGIDELSAAQHGTIVAAMNARIVAEHARPLLDVHGDDVTIETRGNDDDEAISVATTAAGGIVELLGIVIGPDRQAAEQELRRDLAARGLRGDVPRTNGAPVAPRSRPAVTIVVRHHGRGSVDDIDGDEPGSRRRRRIPLLLVAVAGLVLIIALVVGSSAGGRFGSDPAPAPTPTVAPAPAQPAGTTAPTTAPATAAPTSAPVAAVPPPTNVPPNCTAATQRVPWMDQVQCEAAGGSPAG